MSRLSTFAVSTFRPALNVRSTTLPDRTFFSLVRTNAPPLPGLTCWNSMTVHSWPSIFSTVPFLRSLVVATIVASCRVSFCAVRAEARPREGVRGIYGRRPPTIVPCRRRSPPSRRVRRSPPAPAGSPSTPKPATVPVAIGPITETCRNDSRAYGLDRCTSTSTSPACVTCARGVAQRVGVVRERGRVEHDVGPRVDRLVQPADQRRLVVGLPDLDVETQLGGPALDRRRPGRRASPSRRPRARGPPADRGSDR